VKSDISLSNKKITNLATPTVDTDQTNKTLVDSQLDAKANFNTVAVKAGSTMAGNVKIDPAY